MHRRSHAHLWRKLRRLERRRSGASFKLALSYASRLARALRGNTIVFHHSLGSVGTTITRLEVL